MPVGGVWFGYTPQERVGAVQLVLGALAAGYDPYSMYFLENYMM